MTPDAVTIALLDRDSPSYSRTVVRVGPDAYLVVGIDQSRGLLLLEKMAPEPEAKWHMWDRPEAEAL